MKAFAELYAALDQTTKTNGKIAALEQAFPLGERPARLPTL